MKYDFLEKLEEHTDEILKRKDRVLISVVGKGGAGKSYFGKYIRNYGFGKYKNNVISVIDDNVIWIDLFFLFRKKLKIISNTSEGLQPFFRKIISKKKIVFFINATPWQRISEADILLELSTSEETRRKRLIKRYGSDSQNLEKAILSEGTEDCKIKYTYMLSSAT
jgi:dephospho-CoA kinase